MQSVVQADLLSNYRSDSAPLSGKVWDLREEKFIQLETILNQAPSGVWLLLGETHENPDHHQVQQQIIEYLDRSKRLGSVALEMADSSQQPLLDRTVGSDRKTITPERLEWKSGWPWEWYEAPVTTALNKAPTVLAADLTRAEKMEAYRDEQLNIPSNERFERFMLDLLYSSHCEKIPKNQLTNMLRVQYARDRSMIETLRANTTPSGVNLLLAGTVHTRYDLGIPLWARDLRSITLLMIAAETDSDPRNYYPDSYTEQPVADYLLFTPETTYENRCE